MFGNICFKPVQVGHRFIPSRLMEKGLFRFSLFFVFFLNIVWKHFYLRDFKLISIITYIGFNENNWNFCLSCFFLCFCLAFLKTYFEIFMTQIYTVYNNRASFLPSDLVWVFFFLFFSYSPFSSSLSSLSFLSSRIFNSPNSLQVKKKGYPDNLMPKQFL